MPDRDFVEVTEYQPVHGAPPRSRPRSRLAELLFLLAVLVVLLSARYVAQEIAYAIARGQELARAEVARQELANLPADGNRYPLVAKIVQPSVVGIQITAPVVSPFGDVEGIEPGIRSVAQGSGVIVDPSGYIITNAHVIRMARAGGVTVQLSDGRTVRNAAIVGADPATDLAVLKINVGALTAARWGDSDALQVGDSVLAVGSPFGLAETVTAGIISAKDRKVSIERVRFQDFLQTDAAVNPGNSGGPLVNMNGEVVGINTAIFGQTYQGIGFAIPSNLVSRAYELLKTSGISRGWIGVSVQDLTRPLAEKFDLKDARGALVASVAPDSPAEQAGIQPGDVIVRWDNLSIANSNDLRIAVARTKPGTKATVVLHRNGKPQELAVTTAERPNQVEQ
jgi:serine protease Do